MKQITKLFGIFLLGIIIATPTIVSVSAVSLNKTSMWYRLAVYGYKDQLRKGYTWSWSQLSDTKLHHEQLIVACLNRIHYPITQFLLDMHDPHPYPV